jgi:hypothetical protein
MLPLNMVTSVLLCISLLNVNDNFLEFIEKSIHTQRANYVEKTVSDVYEGIAYEFSWIKREEIAGIGGIESKHNKYTSNIQGGRAKGLMQIMPGTEKFLRKMLIAKGKLAHKEHITNLSLQQDLMVEYLKYNTSKLREFMGKSHTPTVEELYIFHNLGEVYGKKVLRANKNTLVRHILPENVINGNKKFYNVTTIGEAKKRVKVELIRNSKTFIFCPNILSLFRS